MMAAVCDFRERFRSSGQLTLCKGHRRGVASPVQGGEDVAWASELV